MYNYSSLNELIKELSDECDEHDLMREFNKYEVDYYDNRKDHGKEQN